jgi:GWxTD domain-containing protein
MFARFILGCAIAVLLIAQTSLAASVVALDYACFRGPDETSYVEIYSSIQRDGLTYSVVSDTLRADFMMVLSIGFQNELVLADTFSGTDIAAHRDSIQPGQFFPHVFQYFMKPGEYQLRASLFQNSEIVEDLLNRPINIRSFPPEQFSLSDIQLGCNLEYTDETDSQFIKNGIRILPNPTRFFGTELPVFYYYLEAYGLAFDSTANDSIAVFRTILRGEDDSPARKETQRIFQKTGPSAALSDGFPVYTLTTGSYKLKLRVFDFASGQSRETEKRFFCYRPDDFAQGFQPRLDEDIKSQLVQTNLNILEVINPDSAIELMHYLFSNPNEENNVKAFNEEGKRAYLREYWGEREREEPDAANKYFARVATANLRYGYFNKPGWKTDRGRVLIMYGEPDDITRNYQMAGSSDHEIWLYPRLEGGVEFVFVDKTGFGVLELVHSTKKGEIKSPHWQSSSPSSIDVPDFRGNK